MNLSGVMDEIATVLDTISGVRTTGYPPPTVSPPAGYVSYPDRIDYHQTYRGGMTRVTDMPVVLVVGKATDRTARDRVTQYTAEAGSASVKAALEAATYTHLYSLVVKTAEFEVVSISGIDYLAAIFTLDITAPGSAE